MNNESNGHINYYIKHNVSPVTYNIDINILLDQRKSLYRGIGITPLTINNKSILEIAAGSGQNSIFLAINNPKNLVLIEPNPKAVLDIRQNNNQIKINHTLPKILDIQLENYNSLEFFDIVICENWLGSSVYERKLRHKCFSLVAKNGFGLFLVYILWSYRIPEVTRDHE